MRIITNHQEPTSWAGLAANKKKATLPVFAPF